MQPLFVLGLCSFLICMMLTPAVRRISLKLGLVDCPDEKRKLHEGPIPRVGGVAIFAAYVGALECFSWLFPQNSFLQQHADVFRSVIPAAGLVFLVGLADDIWGLRASYKLAGQVVAAIIACHFGVQIGNIAGHVTEAWWTLPLTIVWIVGCTNAFNLIDGVDGLACGVGLLATSTTLAAALISGNSALALATVPLVGALLGFLRYNFNPASIFLGDSGSLTIGFLLGCYAVTWSQKSATLLGMAAPLMAMAVPLLDVAVSIVRRFLRRQPIFAADYGHIHHRLLAKGLTPRSVSLILYLVCGFGATLSLLHSALYLHFGGATVVLFCALAILGIRQLNYIEFSAMQRMIVGGAFRAVLQNEILVRDLQAALNSSKTPERDWLVLRDACKTLGFEHIGMRWGGLEHSADFEQSDPARRWSFEVHFTSETSSDSLVLRGGLQHLQHLPILSLIEIVEHKLESLSTVRPRTGSARLIVMQPRRAPQDPDITPLPQQVAR